MSAKILHYLELAADGQFRYSEVDPEVLIQLALQDSDPEVATSALGELTQRDSKDASLVAKQILERDVWDEHLTAYALTVIYSRDPEAGFSAMQRLVRETHRRSIVEAFVENVLSDQARYEHGAGREFASDLATRLTAVVPTQLTSDGVSRFLAVYRDHR